MPKRPLATGPLDEEIAIVLSHIASGNALMARTTQPTFGKRPLASRGTAFRKGEGASQGPSDREQRPVP